MKKVKRSKTAQSTKNNQKITSFFTKCQPSEPSETNVIEIVDDDDIISGTPIKPQKLVPRKSSKVLEEVTNSSTMGKNKKRKNCGDVEEVVNGSMKKVCAQKENEAVASTSKADSAPVKLGSTPVKHVSTPVKHVSTPVKHVSTPVKHGSTPSKHLSTPSKRGCTLPTIVKSAEKGAKPSPSKLTPKKTPKKKLFEKSPNVSEFKVEVLKNFIKVTPSKAEAKERLASPGSVEKKRTQSSILNYTSPMRLRSAEKAQSDNEKTPVNTNNEQRNVTPRSTRVKVKLDFAEKTLSTSLLKPKKTLEEINVENANDGSPEKSHPAKCNYENSLSTKINANSPSEKKTHESVKESSDDLNKISRQRTVSEDDIFTPSFKIDVFKDETSVIKQEVEIIKTEPENVNVHSTEIKEEKEKNFAVFLEDDDEWKDDFPFDAEEYTLDLSTSQQCKVLEINKTNRVQTITVKSTKNEEKAICFLYDFWVDVNLDINCTVHLVAVKSDSSEWIVNYNSGLLVYEPDFLISSTSVVGAIFCKRKSILKDRYLGFDPQNKIMLVGTLVHRILQSCLRNRIDSKVQIETMINDILNTKEIIFDLFTTNLTTEEIKTDVGAFIPQIINFLHQYLPNNKTKVKPSNGNWGGKIDEIQDIEENIWCPELGIKGKIDVSIRVNDSIMPLELKTGKASMSLEHRGQIILYIMMMRRLGYKVPSGLLLYLREGVLKEINMNEREMRDLTLLHNELAYYLTRKPRIISKKTQDLFNSKAAEEELLPGELPPPINHHSACAKCEYNTLCCLFLKHEKFNFSKNRALNEIHSGLLEHLSEAHIKYFIHWSSLLAMESGIKEGKHVSDIYTKTVEQREKNGKCITCVKLKDKVVEINGLFETTFETAKEKTAQSNFLLSGIGEQSYVVVSIDKRPAVAAGMVSKIDFESVTIDLDRDLNVKYPDSIFHLDTYDSNSVNVFNSTCLALLMEASPQADRLRRLIIDKEKPTFKKSLPGEVGRKSVSILKSMNKTQQKAVIKALAANDYLLIKGMPGTGKTATIVALVKFLIELNQSVLIVSHTNLAVDNVCIRLKENGIDLMRLGSQSRIHPNLKDRSEWELTKHCKTSEELEAVYVSANIIAVTCIGSKHPILSKRLMDVCIVDESTQVVQSTVIRALYASKRFFLIGDPDQLTPVVKSREAIERGLSQSLFERLDSEETTVNLNLNYRMNKCITKLANELTYRGELLVANKSIGNAVLNIPVKEVLTTPWMHEALNDDLEKSVCIINTGETWNKTYTAPWIKTQRIEIKNDDTSFICNNPSETSIIVNLVSVLLKGGKLPASIGVIATYRAQVAQLTLFLSNSGVTVSTVDQFQGQDKDVILYSCSKSRDVTKPRKVNKFEILEDKRRLTVAITRAKHKLIIVADVKTVKEYSPFEKLFSCVSSENYLNLEDGKNGFSWDSVMDECKVIGD